MNAGELHQLARRLRELAVAATSEAGEAPSVGEMAIVEDVVRHPGSAVGEIATRTRLAQSLVSKTVAALREGGIFSTAPDPQDRRRMLVSVDSTVRVELLQERGARPIQGVLTAALPEASPAQIEHVSRLLDELAAALFPGRSQSP